MSDDHRKSHVQDGSGVGVGTTFDAVVRAHGKPNSFEFPEGALITLYHFRGGVVAFQLDRGFDHAFFKNVSRPATARVIRIVGDGAVRRKGKAVLTT